jgi:type I restriction enzyme S subunit
MKQPPQIPVPEIWKDMRLSEIGRVVSGATPSTAIVENWDGPIAWITPADLSELRTRHLSSTQRTLTEQGFASCAAKLLPPQSLVISSRAPIGYMALPLVTFCTNQGCKSIEFYDGQHPDFHYYNLRFWVRRLHDKGEGTTFSEISKSALENVRVPVPVDRKAQKTIAGLLVHVDHAIEQTEALVAKLRRIKSGMMHDLLTRGLDAQGRLREPSTHQFKDSALGPIPKEWSIGHLLDATDPSRQPILTGPFGADLGIEDFLPDGVPVLRIGNVQQGELDLSDLLFVSSSKAAELSRYKVRNGDLLFARQGASTGRNALATEGMDGWLINYHIIRVALDRSRCAPLYIEAAFNSDSVKRQVDREKGRGTREGINTAQLKALKLKLAPVEEQREIAKVLAASARRDLPITKALVKLRRVKAGLMQDLLTGRVPVTPLLSSFAV